MSKIGLFGFDFTQFLLDCATAKDSSNGGVHSCQTSKYSPFDGWAVGVGLNLEPDATYGICFATDSVCLYGIGS